MADKLIGSPARDAERRTEEKALRSLRDLHAHPRALVDAAQAVTVAHNERRDPIGWEHISLTGDYVWNDRAQPADQLRPPRRRPSLLAA